MESLFVYATVMPSVWKKIRVEILGNFPETPSGNRYLLFAVDTCTYWTEATALPETSPEAVARFLLSLYFRFGRCEISVTKQKHAFCKKVAECFRVLLEEHDIRPVGEDGVVLRHSQYGVDQLFVLQDRGAEAGVTTGGMALDKNGQLIGSPDTHLPAAQAALFTDADPLNPIPQYPFLKTTRRQILQRSTTPVTPCNLDTDFLALVAAHPTTWDRRLEGFLYHLRSAVAVCNKGYSAYHLMLGRNPVPVTGRELMVRSLTGIREVFALLGGVEEKVVESEEEEYVERGRRESGKKYNLRSRNGECGDASASGGDVGEADGLVLEKECPKATVKTANGKRKKMAKGKNLNENINKKSSKNRRKRKRADILKIKCPECPHTYVTCQEELDLHLQCHTVDEGSGKRIFQCPECGKVCKIWLNMVRHMGHHRDISTFRKLPDECYKCAHCGKDFKVPEVLREHVRVVHEGKKRFECHVCHEKFKVYKTKMRHMDLKHANITYNCRDCDYKTKVRRNLKLHMEKHEKKRRLDQDNLAQTDAEAAETAVIPPNQQNGHHASTPEDADTGTAAARGSRSRLGPFHRLHSASHSNHPMPLPPGHLLRPEPPDLQGMTMPVLYLPPPTVRPNRMTAFVGPDQSEVVPGLLRTGMPPHFSSTLFTFLSPGPMGNAPASFPPAQSS